MRVACADAALRAEIEKLCAADATANIVCELGIGCLLYTSDAADERSSVDLGGRRIINKKKRTSESGYSHSTQSIQTRYGSA